MVRVVRHERPITSGRAGREPPGEVVRLAAGVDEKHGVEAREGREQPFGELDQRLGEIPRVGRAEARLAHDRLGHPRVAVADDGDVVVGIEEPAPVRLVDPDALGADRADGARVRERRQKRAERLVSPPHELRARCRAVSHTELARDLLRIEPVEQLEQAPRVVVPGLDVSGVLGEAAGAPGADRDDRREPRRHQVAQQLELEWLERETGREAVERDPSDPKCVLARPPAQERGEGDGDVGRERRVAAVAEIEDPRDPAALVQQEVVEIEVAVHDLAPQAFPLREHTLLVPVEHARDERPPRGIGDPVEQWTQLRRSAEVPQQLPAGRGVEERSEREAEAGMHGGDPAHRSVAELGPGLVAVPPLEQSHLVAVEGRPRRERPGHRQVRIDGRDVGDRGVLEVEHGLVFARIRDLEDGAAAPVVQEKCLVALAAERGRGALDTEQVCRDPRGLVRRELRRRRLQDRTHEVNGIRRRSPGAARSSSGPVGSFAEGQDPSFERIGSPFCGRIALRCRSTFRRLIGGYCGTFCGIRAVATRR